MALTAALALSCYQFPSSPLTVMSTHIYAHLLSPRKRPFSSRLLVAIRIVVLMPSSQCRETALLRPKSGTASYEFDLIFAQPTEFCVSIFCIYLICERRFVILRTLKSRRGKA
jgi:hypothetical protein